MHARLFRLASLALASALLTGCIPQAQEKPAPIARAEIQINSASFYPRERSLSWTYVNEGDEINKLPYTYTNLGLTLFRGQSVESAVMRGRGADQTWYRTYNNGVFLHGFSKPGLLVTLTPPMQEYPAEGLWQIGLTWEGRSKVAVIDEKGTVQSEGYMTYKYMVQDRRNVTTPAGTFNVWMVTRQMSDDVGGMFPAVQQLWFAPYVGEVKTPEGLLMVGRNFKNKQ